MPDYILPQDLNYTPYGTPLAEIPSEPQGMDVVRQVLATIWRHKLLFGAVALSVTAGASTIVLRLPSAYTATATVAVQAQPTDPLTTDAVTQPLADGAIDTEVDLLKSQAVARQVVDRLGIGMAAPRPSLPVRIACKIEPAWGRCAPRRPPSLEARAEGFLSRLSVTNTGHSQVVELAYTDADPQVAAAALNLVVGLTADAELAGRSELLQRTTNWLNNRAAQLGQAATIAEQAVRNYSVTAGLNTRMVDNTPTPLIADEITSTAAALIQAQDELAAAQAQGTSAGLAPSEPSGATSAVLADLEARRAQIGEIYGDRYPTAQALDRQIAIARSQSGASAGRSAAIGRAHIAALSGKVDRLTRNLAILRAQGNQAEGPLAQMRSLQRAADSANTIYQTFVSRASQAADRAVLLQPSITFVANAVPPDLPSFPKVPKLLAASLAFGLVVGAAAAFLRGALAARATQSGHWIARQEGLPLLARVPEVPVHRRLRNEVSRIVEQEPQSEEADSMRWLLERLGRASPNPDQLGSVVVTSTTVEEGKSTICLWLAQTIAASGKRVLLIDGDQRHGSICGKLGRATGPGLSDWLAGRKKLKSVLSRTTSGSFDFMPPGAPFTKPLTTRELRRLRGLLAHLKRVYAVVVIDAAPVLAMAEAEAYASVASHTVLVCRDNRMGEAAVQNSANRLRAAGANVTGLVLSMTDFDVPDRYGEGVTRKDIKLLRRYYA